MGALRNYVAGLSDEECRAIHDQAVEWERRGEVEDGPLRTHARLWQHAAGLNDSNVSLWMRELTAEVWRKYAVGILHPPQDPDDDCHAADK